MILRILFYTILGLLIVNCGHGKRQCLPVATQAEEILSEMAGNDSNRVAAAIWKLPMARLTIEQKESARHDLLIIASNRDDEPVRAAIVTLCEDRLSLGRPLTDQEIEIIRHAANAYNAHLPRSNFRLEIYQKDHGIGINQWIETE